MWKEYLTLAVIAVVVRYVSDHVSVLNNTIGSNSGN